MEIINNKLNSLPQQVEENMEKAALFNLMSIIFFSIAAILLIVAVIMFIKFNIKEILNNYLPY